MATKKITVVDAGVSVSGTKELLGSQAGYEKLLDRLGVAFLIDEDGFHSDDFESLTDGGRYEPGQ